MRCAATSMHSCPSTFLCVAGCPHVKTSVRTASPLPGRWLYVATGSCSGRRVLEHQHPWACN
eukprot:2282491-Pyramimonas_sp.AAC.1